jgi:uncharacterized BrkB/YihY/UPF0761 family membrane protein
MRRNFGLPNFRSLKPKNPWPFLAAVWKKFHRDNAFFLARGLAFDVLVCLIPALFLLFVLFGFLFDSSRETIQYMSSYLKSMIPFSQQQVLRNLFALVLWVYYSCLVFILGAEMGWLWSRKKKTAE